MKTSEIMDALDEVIPNPKCSLNYEKDYEILIATMLSAQSTDKRVNEVTKYLFKYDIHDLANMDAEKLMEIIKPVGTQRRKSEYIKAICMKLINDYDGRVPHDRQYVESLPGVGHKTCNVVFSEIFGDATMPVDTHITRVSKRLGIAKESDDVVAIERKLCKKFPREKWSRLHLQLVLFGRHYCTSKSPKCGICPFRLDQCKKPLN